MDPICLQEIDKEDNAAEGPCDGVCPGHGGELIDKLYGNGDIGDPEQAPAGQHGKHGNGSFSCAPHHTGDAVGKGQQEVKRADGAHMLGSKVDGFCRIAEKAD